MTDESITAVQASKSIYSTESKLSRVRSSISCIPKCMLKHAQLGTYWSNRLSPTSLVMCCSKLLILNECVTSAQSGVIMQVDLLPSEGAVSAVEHAIHSHNAAVEIIRTTRCSLDIAQILNRGAFVGSSQPPSLQTAKQITDLNGLEIASAHNHQPASSSAIVEQSDDVISQAADTQQHQHDGHGKLDEQEQEHHHHHHDNAVRSVSVTCPGKVELTR